MTNFKCTGNRPVKWIFAVSLAIFILIHISSTLVYTVNHNYYQTEMDISTSYIMKPPNFEFNNIDLTRMDAVTTEDDYNHCKQILDIYNNKSIQWPELHSKFEKQSFTFVDAQSMQDWFLFSSMFRSMFDSGKRGVYLDLAANWPKMYSNTFFFDKCLSWNGICIEAEPNLIPLLRKVRSCHLVQTCVWSEPKNLTFSSVGADPRKRYAYAGLKDYNTISVFKDEKANFDIINIPMQCTTLSKIISDFGLTHIDYLSLDIEGAETHALMGVDFSRVRIDVLTVEINGNDTQTDTSVFGILATNGYLPKFRLPRNDVVFIHSKATDKIAAIDHWIATVPWQNIVPKYDRTEMFGADVSQFNN